MQDIYFQILVSSVFFVFNLSQYKFLFSKNPALLLKLQALKEVYFKYILFILFYTSLKSCRSPRGQSGVFRR